MSHVQHYDSLGNKTPSVSEVPNITKEFFFEDMSGYQDWVCRNNHKKDERCCTRAQREYYQECADLGNDIHALREAFLRGESFSEGVPEYQAKVFEPVARFYKASGYKPLHIQAPADNGRAIAFDAIELKMTGKEFGGTLDGAGTFGMPFWETLRKTFWDKTSRPFIEEFKEPAPGDVWIEDLKIKSKLDVLHPLQLYGYRLLLQETQGITADWGLIIRREKKLDKTPELQLRGYYLPTYKNQWDASMLMWKFLNE